MNEITINPGLVLLSKPVDSYKEYEGKPDWRDYYRNKLPITIEHRLWKIEQIGKGVNNFKKDFNISEGDMVIANIDYQITRTFQIDDIVYSVVNPKAVAVKIA